MSALFDNLDVVSAVWAQGMLRAGWQGALSIFLAWGICRALPRIPPRAQCWIWRLAYVKLLVALAWGTPVDLPLLPPAPDSVAIAEPREPLPATQDLATERVAIPHSRVEMIHPRSVRMANCLFVLWLCGVAWCWARIYRCWRQAESLRRKSVELDLSQANPRWVELSRKFVLARRPPILACDGVGCPLVLGIFRPAIILPTRMAQDAWNERAHLMLAHELAHVQRCDLLWNWLPALVQSLFFFHPLVWLAWREWEFSREAACDELTLLRTDAAPAEYAELLVAAAVPSVAGQFSGLMTVGILGSFSSLRRRIMAMKFMRPLSNRQWVLLALVLASAGILGLVPWRLSRMKQAAAIQQQAADKYAIFRESLDKQLADLRKSYSNVQSELDEYKRFAEKQIIEKDARIVGLHYMNKQLAAELDKKTGKNSAVPDGQIRWVDPVGKKVWISLGEADGVKPRATFNVYKKQHSGVGRGTVNPDFTDEGIKGSIEVTRVMEAHLSEARIIFEEIYRPIAKGDPIYSPAWRAGHDETFSVIGMIDLDGDGTDDRDLFREIVSTAGASIDNDVDTHGVLRVNGQIPDDGQPRLSEKTKFLVIAKIPEITETTDADEKARLLKIYELRKTLQETARQRGVRVVSLADFLRYVGYKPQRGLIVPGRDIPYKLKSGAHPAGAEKSSGPNRQSQGATSGDDLGDKAIKPRSNKTGDGTSKVFRGASK